MIRQPLIPWNRAIAGLLLCNVCFQAISSTTTENHEGIGATVFVILSQPNTFHSRQAQNNKLNISKQAKELGWDDPVIHLLHEDWPETGSWTIFPILSDLLRLHFVKASWIFFIDEFTKVDLEKLHQVLARYNSSRDWFLGHALYDRDATIIHHFAFYDSPRQFAYPDFAAGFALSMPLLRKLAHSWADKPDYLDFSIDPKYEFALYSMRHTNVNLTDVDEFCVTPSSSKCSTAYSMKLPTCGSSVPASELYFAVKTCEKFHKERVSIVKNTWGLTSEHIEYFSNKADAAIPTRALKVPNTEKGHCAKTLAILSYVASRADIINKSWLIIADDDTLLSVSRLQQLLSCYDPIDSVAIGERYGFSVTSKQGYDYITGGGSMVFSMSVVRQLVDGGRCICPADDTPDDMFLGICLKRLGIPITHSPLFHQARPQDYADDYLSHQKAVSFHKHWLIDPIAVYTEWLEERNSDDHHMLHMEL